MKAHRSLVPRGHRPAPAGLVVLVLIGAALAISAVTACGDGDDTTINNFIGVTDAEPPRLGRSDAGAR